MTIEHKIIVSLEEITAIVLKCTTKGCNSRTSFSPDKSDIMPPKCPHGHQWTWEVYNDKPRVESPIMIWLELLRKLRDPMTNNCGFKICLEFDEPNAK